MEKREEAMDAQEEKARTLAIEILDAAAMRGAEYADVRAFLADEREIISVNSGFVEEPIYERESGVGIRVLVDGAWGFASFPDFSRPLRSLRLPAKRTLENAILLAKASAHSDKKITLASTAKSNERDSWSFPFAEDPFRVSMEEKVNLLMQADKAMEEGSTYLIVRNSQMTFWRTRKLFAALEKGAYRFITQNFMRGGLYLYAAASDGSDIQSRSYGFGKNSNGGFENIKKLDLQEVGSTLASEAEALLWAPECPKGLMDVILLPDQASLHVHETGHGLEADRILGYEDTYIGGTFVADTFYQIGSYNFGSEAVNIVADATLPEGYGTFGFDDDGIPARKFFLVENGILKNLLTSRETVPQLNNILEREYFDASNGTSRAHSYSRIPLIRMTNIILLPGRQSVEELISRVKRGIMLTGAYSWSMSENRENFDFGLEKGILIENGKIGSVVKNPGYTGSNSKFWKSLEGVASQREFEVLNIPNCGKGQPAQYRFVGHGSPPALFRKVRVYNRRHIGESLGDNLRGG